MLPVVAIVGRPNVGKSTLFNRLTKTQDALVIDMPGVTRDRQYGRCAFDGHHCIIIDTGGLQDSEEPLNRAMQDQVKLAIQEADLILFVVDARSGLVPDDLKVVQSLRQANKEICLVVNKIDGLDVEQACCDYYELGLEQPIPIAASHGRGVSQLMATVFTRVSADDLEQQQESGEPNPEGSQRPISVTLVGKPNVGKSTLTNRLLGEERMLVSDIPGTTRDAVVHTLDHRGQSYNIIDTAGLRRKTKVREVVDKFSMIKTLGAIERSDVVLFMIDAHEGVSDLDTKLLGHVLNSGRAVVVLINKCDGMSDDQKSDLADGIDRFLHFVSFARVQHISAKHGTGVGKIFAAVKHAYAAATQKIPTTELTEFLLRCVEQHPPPLVNGRRIKLRYAHMGGHQPPLIIIHGNQTDHVPAAYQRYLSNAFRDRFAFHGTPVRLRFKSGDNPFSGKKNQLTQRQIKKRQRIRRFSRKGK